MRRSFAVLAIAAALTAMLLSGCGGDDDDNTPAGSSSPTTSTATARATSGTTTVDPAKFRNESIPPALVSGMSAGNSGARVTLEMFEDFQCPHCLAFTLQFEPLLIDEYVVPGKVRLQFRNLPILGEESANAAIGAACAAKQDKFWPYHKELFLVQLDAGQLTNEKVDAGRFAPSALSALATKVGLDSAAFDACLDSAEIIDTVNADIRAAQAAGFRGTPSFLLNGKPVASPADEAGWRKLLDAAVAGN